MEAELRSVFARAGFEPSDEDWAFFERLHEVVLAGNRTMNLTRIADRTDFFLKHVLDSALPFVRILGLGGTGRAVVAADLGSGAGFPGLVLARLHPHWKVALLERTRKKAAYLEDAVARLALGNAYVVPFDAREAPAHAPALAGGCDLVVARAVGRIDVVTRAAAPLLRRDGLLVHYKGGAPDAAELEEGRRCARKLRMTQHPPVAYDLPPAAHRSVVVTVNRPSGRRRGAGHHRS